MSFFCISENIVAEDLDEDDDVAILLASGEIDFGASPQLREHILGHIHAGRRHVLLDLSEVTFIDSTAIGVLAGAAGQLREAGDPTFAIVCPEYNRRVRRILDIAGLGGIVILCQTRDEALSALAATN